jgi:hypothetical protein
MMKERAQRTRALNELIFADDLQCRVELLVLLRRIAGGVNASEQQELYGVALHSNRFFRTFGADKSRSLVLSIICTIQAIGFS